MTSYMTDATFRRIEPASTAASPRPANDDYAHLNTPAAMERDLDRMIAEACDASLRRPPVDLRRYDRHVVVEPLPTLEAPRLVRALNSDAGMVACAGALLALLVACRALFW
jgi:hypothetical protein